MGMADAANRSDCSRRSSSIRTPRVLLSRARHTLGPRPTGEQADGTPEFDRHLLSRMPRK
jgi:hypothetical protein